MEERSHRHILNLVTQMTITGLSANEIECALIPMMARNISSTMKPNTLTHDQTRYLKLILATHGRSIHGSCVDGSLLARINLTFLQIGRVQSCVRPVDAALIDGRWP